MFKELEARVTAAVVTTVALTKATLTSRKTFMENNDIMIEVLPEMINLIFCNSSLP